MRKIRALFTSKSGLSKAARPAPNAISRLALEQRFLLDATAASTAVEALDIPIVELSCGSVRCTIAGIHLSPRG